VGDDRLLAVRQGLEAGAAEEGRAEVVSAPGLDGAGVDGDADGQAPANIGPVFGLQRSVGVKGGLQRRRRLREGGVDRVAHGLEDDALVAGDQVCVDLVMARERTGGCGGAVLLEQAGAALQVAEQERDHAGRQGRQARALRWRGLSPDGPIWPYHGRRWRRIHGQDAAQAAQYP
jgi:hypothetical protein